MRAVILNDIWEGIEEGRENALYINSLINPYINYIVNILRGQGYQIIHHPRGVAEYYKNYLPRQNVKKLIDDHAINYCYEEHRIKQSDQIVIKSIDLITNHDTEIQHLINVLNCEEITIVGFHLNICIECLIQSLHEINFTNIRVVGNCTLPFRDERPFVGFDDILDYLRHKYNVKIVHL